MTTPICPECHCNTDIVCYLEETEEEFKGLYQCLNCKKVIVWYSIFVPPKESQTTNMFNRVNEEDELYNEES